MTPPSPAEIHELNIRMAREVMGWPLIAYGVIPNPPTYPLIRDHEGVLVVTTGIRRIGGYIWKPASDPVQAVELAEKFSTEFTFGDGNAFEIVQLLFEVDRWAFSVSGLKGPFVSPSPPRLPPER